MLCSQDGRHCAHEGEALAATSKNVQLMRSQSWSWPWYGEVADKLENQLEQLEAPTTSPQLFKLAGGTGVFLSDFTWPDLFPPFPGIDCDPAVLDLPQ